MKKLIFIGIGLLALVVLFGCENLESSQLSNKEIKQEEPSKEQPISKEILKSEFFVSVLNEGNNDIEVEIRDENGNSIAIINVPSKEDYSTPSYKDITINIMNNEQEIIIKENNEGISEVYHFDPEIGRNLIVSYFPPGRNENGIIQPSGKLIITQQEGYPMLD